MKAGKPNRMTIGSLLARARRGLKATSDSPDLDAEIILAHVLGKPKIFLYTHADLNTTALQRKKFQRLVLLRKKGMPVAYLTGNKEFFGLQFKVNRSVLIPRPETEQLVELVLRSLKNYQLPTTNHQLLDLGTGSGCIAVALASELLSRNFKIWAGDNSKEALKIAKKNAHLHKSKIRFFHGNLLEPLHGKKIDIIVANLPYGWDAWKNNTSAQTRGLKFEPRAALFTDEFGLGLYRQLFQQIALRKTPPLHIFLEFDPRQKLRLQKLVKLYLPAASLEFHKDLAGNWRFAHISFLRYPGV